MGGASHYLVQQEMYKVLIRDKAPQVHLQVVAINLDLLQAIAAEGAQSDTLEERLQTDFDDSCHHRDLGEWEEVSKRDREAFLYNCAEG